MISDVFFVIGNVFVDALKVAFDCYLLDFFGPYPVGPLLDGFG